MRALGATRCRGRLFFTCISPVFLSGMFVIWIAECVSLCLSVCLPVCVWLRSVHVNLQLALHSRVRTLTWKRSIWDYWSVCLKVVFDYVPVSSGTHTLQWISRFCCQPHWLTYHMKGKLKFTNYSVGTICAQIVDDMCKRDSATFASALSQPENDISSTLNNSHLSHFNVVENLPYTSICML